MAFRSLSDVGVGRGVWVVGVGLAPHFYCPTLENSTWRISLGISFFLVLRNFPAMCARVKRPKNTLRHSSGANKAREVILMWEVDEQAGYLNCGSILRFCTHAM